MSVQIQRRHLLAASGAGAAVAAVSAAGFAWAQAGVGTPTPVANGVRRMQLGTMEVIALNDGVLRRPLGEEFVRNAPLANVQAELRMQGLPTEFIDTPFTPFLVVDGGQRTLIDTGFADNGPPTTGRLRANLNSIGLTPDSIDTVLISHFHGDHINGLRDRAGQLVFPRARILVPEPEYAFWMDDARMNAAPEAMRGAFMAVRRVFAGMPPGRVQMFTPGIDVMPGIASVPAYGHTPGHTLFRVESLGQRFMYVADLTNIPELFARQPDWAVQFDMNADQARETRRRVFDMLVSQRMTAGGFHFPFPAFGTIARANNAGNGYQFTPTA
jgi:glyoxylase-like metal-dependent hydrolase (beta-lactamase superfamily II)